MGFSIKLGNWSTVEAELWALIYGLRITWERGVTLLVAEIDSLLAYSWFTKKDFKTSKNPYAGMHTTLTPRVDS